MVDKLLRTPKRLIMQPAARQLGDTHPGWITLLAFLAGLGCVLAAAFALYGLALTLWLANRVLDGLDGELARAQETQTDLGGYLDLMGDLAIYATLPIALVLADPSPAAWLTLSLMLAMFYVNAGAWMLLSGILEKRGRGAVSGGESTSLTMPTGLIEGAETVLLFSLFLLFPQLLPWLFGLCAVLVAATSVQRLAWAARILPEPGSRA